MLNIAPVNPKTAVECLKAAYDANITLMLWGAPGIGKTSIINEFAKQRNLKVINFKLTQIEPGDLAVPFVDPVKERLVMYLTERIPLDGKEDIILFFDELPNAENRVQVAVYEIVLDRVLCGHPLPDNMYVIAAGNNLEDNCNVYEMSAALADRFTHLSLVPDVQQWLKEYAPVAGIDMDVQIFLKAKPDYFNSNQMQNADGQTIQPTPRTWEVVSNIMKKSRPAFDEDGKQISEGYSKDVVYTLVSGRIGKAAAAEFFNVLEELEDLPPIEDLFNAKTDKEIKTLLEPVQTLAPLYGLAYSLAGYCKSIEDCIRATEILNVMVKLGGNLPRAEIQTLGMELIIDIVTRMGGSAPIKFAQTKAFKSYEGKANALVEMSI